MNDKKDPLIPDIRPAKNDAAPRPRRASEGRTTASTRKAAAPTPPPAPAKQTLATVSIILVVALSALSGYLFLQLQTMQTQFSQVQRMLDQQGQGLGGLQEKLSVTGENASLSLDALKTIIKEQDKEIRKLWDVSNKRNKSNIASNRKKTAKNASDLKKQASKLSAAMSEQKDALSKSINDTKADLATLSTDMGNKISQVEASALAAPAALEIQLSQQKEDLEALKKAVKNFPKPNNEKVNMARYDNDIRDIKLAIEDLQIRLDRLQ